MKIKKLELCGFKSFKDRTVVQFDDGITGVVGPNGCGKSNIVDALQWVMGEQSAKHLRGSAMSDVIFAGSEGYAPMGLAEVSLVLENDGGPFPAKYARFQEIMVTRRLHRSGDSEYLINKEPARLRDVHEIFMDTGVGAKGFSIIEQGAIGKIITAKPEERRHLIEEAAGITKFRVRKRESERKLADTEQNLVRLADIVGEIKRQLDSLQRQAKKAEKYREVKNQLRELDLWLSCRRFTEIKDEVQSLQTRLVEVENTALSSQARKAELDSQIQNCRLLVAEIEKKVHERQSQKFEAQSEVQRKEGEIQKINFEIESARRNEQMTGNLLQELEIRKVAIETDLGQARIRSEAAQSESERALKGFEEQQEVLSNIRRNLQEADDSVIEKRRGMVTTDQARNHIQAQVNSGEGRLEELRERLERSQAVLGELEGKQEEFERIRKRHFDDLERERQLQLAIMSDVDNFTLNREQLENIVEAKKVELDEKRNRLIQVETLLASLENLDQNLEGFQEGVKQVVQWQKDQNTNEFRLVADLISVPNQFELAVEAVLGQRLQVLLGKTTVGSVQAIQMLREKSWGRSSFLSLNDLVTDTRALSHAPETSEIEAKLSEKVTVQDGEYANAIHSLLGNVAVASSLQAAIGLRIKYPHWTFVTLEGEVLSADGILTGGSLESADSGLLKRKREIKELSTEKDTAAAQLSVVQHELKEFQAKLDGVVVDLENAQKVRTEKEIAIAEKKKDLERAENELQNLLQAIKKSQNEVSDVQNQVAVSESKLSELQAELDKLSSRKDELEAEIESLSVQLNTWKGQLDSQLTITTELQVKSASKKQEAEGLKKQVALYEQSLKDITEQMAKMSEESSKSNQTLTLGQIQLEQEKVKLEGLIHQVSDLASQLAQVQDEYEKHGGEARILESELSDVSRRGMEAQGQSGEMRLKLEQLNLREQNIVSQIFERYSQPLDQLVAEYALIERDVVAVEVEVGELRDKISKMGEVSLSAINEYEELMQRYEFLSKQQNDLLESKDQLHKVIERIDKICSKQFKDTFESVNERFKKVFPVLFGGGEANLNMVYEEGETDPGIDIIVKPPGKKMQNITLLSGGEKALTSVALIFSIFLVKPSPFCLLDEVDAPLDDANVFRFNELVREMAKRSQIIIVTHNKYTMEVNNKLYGVTMEERGVSKMVSVDLTDAKRVAEATA